jgi:hypothetical protein
MGQGYSAEENIEFQKYKVYINEAIKDQHPYEKFRKNVAIIFKDLTAGKALAN